MSQTEVQLIKDAVIVNADVSGSAAIDASKISGTVTAATTATNVTVADESSDTTCFPLFATAATGNLPPKSGSNLTFNSDTGVLTATSFAGSGANLTGITSTTINTNADNRVITGSDTANTLNGQSAVTINSGRLFIGNTNPAASTNADDLCIGNNDNSAESGITLGSNTASGIRFADGASNSAAVIEFEHGSTNALKFTSGGAEHFRVNGDGDVLINRTTTIDTSEIFGIKGPSGDHCTFGMTTDGTTNLGIIAFNDNDADFRGQIRYRHSSDQLEIFTAGTERFRFESGGNLKLLDGDLTIGASGHGIDFSDTSDAGGMTSELLDDYEEGTYTAHFNIEGQGNMSMSGRVGLYVRVGQMVTVMGGGTVASVSGASSGTAIQFSNLPFPIHTTSSNVGHPFPVLMKNMDSTGLGNMAGNQPYSFIGRLFTDSDGGRIEAIRADGAQDAVNSGLALATNTDVHYMFTYRTDA